MINISKVLDFRPYYYQNLKWKAKPLDKVIIFVTYLKK